MKVLVVEDDMTTSLVLGYACKQAGHDVTPCPDAEVAWEKIRARRYDLIVLDLHLPGMSGAELSRLIRMLPPEQQPYILIVTGSSDPLDIRDALEKGANDFLCKPIDPGMLNMRLVVAAQQAEAWSRRLDTPGPRPENDERLQLALKAARMGTWDVDLATKRSYSSDECLVMQGRPPGFTYTGFEHWMEDIHPDDRAQVHADYEAAMSGKRPYDSEFRTNWREPEKTRWVSIHGAFIRDASGNPTRIIGVMYDITERRMALEKVRQSETALRENDAQLRVYLDSCQDGTWTRSLVDDKVTWSERYYRILGYEPNEFELTFNSLFDHMHPDDVEPIKNAVREHVDKGAPYRVEYRLKHKDGHWVWLHSQGKVYRNAEGKAISIMGAVRDISAQKNAEEALKQSERRLRLFFDATQDGLWQRNVDSQDLFWSDRVYEILGYKVGEIQSNFEMFKNSLHPDDLPIVLKAIQAHMENNTTYRVEARMRRKDGSYIWMLIRGQAHRDAAGKPLFIIGAVTDISIRKKVEEELRASEHRYRTLIENAPEAVVVMDVDKKVFIDYNAAAERLFKMSGEELCRVGPIELSPGTQPDGIPSAERVLQKIRETVQGGTPYFDWTHINSQGEPIPCEIRLLRLPDPSRILIRGSITDISERKRLEEQLRQAMKMEAIGKLAGGVAHDFNNLLMVIQGHIEFLQDRIAGNDLLRRNIDPIGQAATRAAELTRQLLAFSRQTVLKAEVLDLNKIVAEAGNMLRRLIGEDIEFKTICTPDLGRIKADATQVHQVIMNLAVNARDAMPQGGRLSLETANVVFDAEYTRRHIGSRPGPYVMLEISDTGHGMDAKTKARIFEPFFTTKPRGQGTGLGLAMTYGFVKQSGGYISVSSEPGSGSSFKIYFPRIEEEPVISPLATSKIKLLRGTETILLVEDEQPVRELVRDILDLHGYKVLEAPNGMEALVICEQFTDPIELMITDVIMPGMSGSQLAEKALVIRPAMKVLYTSGYTDDAIAQHGVLEPGTEFVQKPYSAELLARKIRKILDAVKKKSN